MHRRRFLATSASLLGYACAAHLPVAEAAQRRRRLRLPRAHVSWDQVTRTIVGLRPRRESGFRLRAETFNDTLIIHNYGHGGAGMSLAWGCAALAGELAQQGDTRRAAVIGCGAPGLATARELQQRGFVVTIYAMTVPPETTSNMSLAAFSPASGLIDPERRTPEWDAQFRRAVALSYARLQQMLRPAFGVSWIDTFTAVDDLSMIAPGPDDAALMDMTGSAPPREVFGRGDHPFPTRYATRTRSLRIEPSIYLDTLVNDFHQAGGQIVRRRFERVAELLELEEAVVVNCTGLGARDLFGDEELVPVKGQLTVLTAQPEINYRVAARTLARSRPGTFGPSSVSSTPRSDGLVIGNFQDRGNWSLEPDRQVERETVEGAMEFFSKMKAG